MRGRRGSLEKLREQRRRLHIQGVSPGLFLGVARAQVRYGNIGPMRLAYALGYKRQPQIDQVEGPSHP